MNIDDTIDPIDDEPIEQGEASPAAAPSADEPQEPKKPGHWRGFHCIPEVLRVLPQWVVWKYQKRGSKLTKVPFRASNPFAMAKADDPSTWGTFEEALRAWNNRHRNRVEGIGFVFSAEDPYCGIDLDNSLAGGRLQPWAEAIMERLQPTYVEISPSGTGVKIWVIATLSGTGTRKADYAGKGSGTAVEIYDRNRFFTVTGDSVSPDNLTVEDRSEYVAELYASLKAKPKKKSGPKPEYDRDTRPPLALSDSEIVTKARKAKNGDKFAELWGGGGDKGSASENDMALCAMIAFFTGPDPARIDRIFSSSHRADREKWTDRPDYRERTISAALDGMTEFYSPSAGPRSREAARSAGDETNDGEDVAQDATAEERESEDEAVDHRDVPNPSTRPTIFVSLDEYVVADEAIAALARDSEVYYRGPKLAEVVHEPAPPSKAFRRSGSALRIATMELPRVRDLLTRAAKFVKLVWDPEMKDYVEERVMIPKWLPAAVAARGVWQGTRPITGIIETPILLPDGKILNKPGYDRSTGLFYQPSIEFQDVADQPTHEEAKEAASKLLLIVQDFPFLNASHKMAWLSSLLTPFARHAIDGPVPLHHFDANTRGIGKTMLGDIDAMAYTGRGISRTAYTDDDNEFRKRITAIALEGDALMLFDNIDTPFGGASFDAALTAMTWKDRILGISGMTGELPLTTCFYSSGNNTVFKGDISRRMLMVRLETTLAEPDKRNDFKIKEEPPKYVEKHRAEVVKAVLTILRAHFVAGRPDGNLIPMGSYLEWSKIVRSAVHWVTGIDPLDSVEYLKKTDIEAIQRSAIIESWSELPPRTKGYTALEALNMIRENGSKYDNLRSVLLEWSKGTELPSPRSIGMRLNHIRDRVIGDRKFIGHDDKKSSTSWEVVPADYRVTVGGTKGTSGTNSNPTYAESNDSMVGGWMDEPSQCNDPECSTVESSPSSPASPPYDVTEDFEI